MNKRKALIRAYTVNNLGDDLFVYLLFRKFPDVNFYTDNFYNFNKVLEGIENYKALPIFRNKRLLFLNKYLRLFYIFRFQTTVEIGGSIFVFPDATLQIIRRLKKPCKKKYFILGTNFGPFRDEEDRLLGLKLFKQINSIVFREKYSYDLFPELKNSDYAADIVFSYQPENENEQKNEVVITVVDYKRFENGEDYINKLIELIEHYTSKNKKVILYSFCQAEGDNKTITEIRNRLLEEKKVNLNYLSTYTHKKLKDSLDILQEAQTIIASRFHAMILGWVLRKQTIVLHYSNKFTNVIKEFFPEQQCFEIRTLGDCKTEDIINSYFVADEIRLRKYREDASNHFKRLMDHFNIN